jgi:hypothetical protein
MLSGKTVQLDNDAPVPDASLCGPVELAEVQHSIPSPVVDRSESQH